LKTKKKSIKLKNNNTLVIKQRIYSQKPLWTDWWIIWTSSIRCFTGKSMYP